MEEKEGMLESKPADGSKPADSSSEPLLVGTNITFKLDSNSDGNAPAGDNGNASSSDNQTSAGGGGPIAVGTNLTIDLSGADSKTLEQLGINKDGSNDYLGTNISSSGDGSSWMNRVDGDPLTGGAMPSAGDNAGGGMPSASGNAGGGMPSASGNAGGGMPSASDNAGGGMPSASGNAPSNDENYKWDFNASSDELTSGGNNEKTDEMTAGGSTDSMGGDSNLDSLFQQSPWGPLKEVGITSFEQVFPNASTDASNNPFAGGENPMSGGMGGGAMM